MCSKLGNPCGESILLFLGLFFFLFCLAPGCKTGKLVSLGNPSTETAFNGFDVDKVEVVDNREGIREALDNELCVYTC